MPVSTLPPAGSCYYAWKERPPSARQHRDGELLAQIGRFHRGIRGRRSRPTEVSRFIDEYRGRFGVEPICRVLSVSASAYYRRASGQRSRRAVQDEWLLELFDHLETAAQPVTGSTMRAPSPARAESSNAPTIPLRGVHRRSSHACMAQRGVHYQGPDVA
jgi:hypothetical protein